MKRKHIVTWVSLTFIIIAALISLELNVYFEEHPSIPTAPKVVEMTPATLTYISASQDIIVPTLPSPGATVGKEFTVTGKARGTWYFEASFPIKLLDKDGVILATIPAKATTDWMTTEFVPFVATMTVPTSYKGEATIILQKDNPSGMPENDASLSFPVSINY